ncbi:MAG: DUF4352 domain-containing protein [Oscillospiraceae bacterium]|nr:DUF4352 domain-containing protein [Oscillospiraceae bacterium]
MKKFYTILALILCTLMLITACNNDAEPEKEEEGPLTLGQTFEFEGLEITLGRNIGFTQFRSSYSDNDGAYVFFIPATVKNISDSSNGLNQWQVTVFSPAGVSITNTPGSSEIEWAFEDSIFQVGNVQPDVIQQGNIYVLYDTDGEYIVEFDSHMEDKIEVRFEMKFDFAQIPTVKTEFAMGETLEVDGMEITFINDVSWGVIHSRWSDNDGKPYFYFPVSLRNTSDEAKGFPWSFTIHGPNGQTVDTVEWDIDEEGIRRANEVVPGASIQENLHVLHVGDGEYKFTFSDWSLMDDLTITLSVTLDPDALPVIQTEFTLNETFVFDDFEITIGDDIEWIKINSRWSEFHNRDVAVFPITVKNVGDSTNSFGYNFKLYGPNGIELDRIAWYVDDDVSGTGDIRSGATLESKIHILYEEDGEYVIEFSNYRDRDISVFIPIAKDE